MAWYVHLAHFGAGVFLANGVPHFVNGISGNTFQSPFASPPGVGESSPVVNVIWGMVNFLIGYLLLFGVGDFILDLNISTCLFGLGALIIGILLARHFGNVRSS